VSVIAFTFQMCQAAKQRVQPTHGARRRDQRSLACVELLPWPQPAYFKLPPVQPAPIAWI